MTFPRLLLSLAFTFSFSLIPAKERKPPNILKIVIDDLGSGDLSSEGHPWLKTPHLDGLRKDSLRMTDFMVSPTCAPTRAALLTGAHEFVSGVTHTIHGMEQMNQQSVTLPQILKTAGYSTGMFGKWHLGFENGYEPWKRGFDETVIAENDGKGPAHSKAVDPLLIFNGTKKQIKGTRDYVFAQEAMSFMEKDRDQPFFCYYATYDPHRAHWAEPRFVEQTEKQMQEADQKGLLKSKNKSKSLFFAEVLQTDWIIGELLDFLDEAKLSDNTLVYFVTDNGATDGVDFYNKEMRGHKSTSWVGGTRALSYWRLPGILQPRDLGESIAHIDVLPTLAEVAGATLDDKAKKQVTGRSAWKLMTGASNEWPLRYLHAHVARWKPGERNKHKYEGSMVRYGDYDLVRTKTSVKRKFYTDHPEFHRSSTPNGEWALYHRKKDLRQEHNLAKQNPELVNKLSKEFERWWKDSEQYLIHE